MNLFYNKNVMLFVTVSVNIIIIVVNSYESPVVNRPGTLWPVMQHDKNMEKVFENVADRALQSVHGDTDGEAGECLFNCCC